MDEEQYKYICEKCKFKCNYKSVWEKHIETELHKTGKKKKRSNCVELRKCEQCEYITKQKGTMKVHFLSAHADLETREKEFKYYCKLCDFGTFTKTNFDNHNKSDKHNKRIVRDVKHI